MIKSIIYFELVELSANLIKYLILNMIK